jgi:RNA recognition motif-containing protein
MKIYVGNLPFSVDEAKLKELFSGYETSEIALITDKFNGRSKGFGFVTIEDDEAAKKAIAEFNEKDVEGRQLKVSEAKPMDPDAPRRPRRDFNGGGRSFGGNRDGGRSFGGNRGGGQGRRY